MFCHYLLTSMVTPSEKKSANITKHNLNKTLIPDLISKHFCLKKHQSESNFWIKVCDITYVKKILHTLIHQHSVSHHSVTLQIHGVLERGIVRLSIQRAQRKKIEVRGVKIFIYVLKDGVWNQFRNKCSRYIKTVNILRQVYN